MDKEKIKELDIVALPGDISTKHLSKGAIGTIVHVYNNFYEVEFSDLNGHAFCLTYLTFRKTFAVET